LNLTTVRAYTTDATRLKRLAALLTRLLLLCQNDDSQAVSPNFEIGDGFKDPKNPVTTTCTAPLMANSSSVELSFNATPVNENAPGSDPRLSSTDDVKDKPEKTPLAERHETIVSLCHRDDVHAVAPIRTPPLQSDSPALVPYTNTLICAVEGCRDGNILVTTREYNISGNFTPPCVCNGQPKASNVDTLTIAAAAAAAAAFVNPATVHTIAAVGNAGAAAVDRFSSSTPEEGVKAVDAVTVDGSRLEHEAGAAAASKDEKRKPEMDMSLKAEE
jgi:hypothetical protein